MHTGTQEEAMMAYGDSNWSTDDYVKPDWAGGGAPVETDNEIGDAKAGMLSGYHNLKAAYGGAKALVGETIGVDSWVDPGLEMYQRETAEAAKYSEGKITDISQINGVGDLADFFQFHIASGAVSTLPTLMGGGAGGVVAKKALTSYISDKVQTEMKKGLTEKAAAQAVAAKVSTKGATAGAFTGAEGQLSGATFGNIYEETGQKEAGKAWVSGTSQASLEIIPGMAILKKMGLGKVAQEGIQQNVDGILKATGKIAAKEGGTEALQGVMETATLKWVEENRDLLGEEGYHGMLNNFAAGFAGGTGMGAGSHLIGGGPLRNVKLTPDQIEQNKAKLQSIVAARADAKAQAAADATGGDALTRAIADTQSREGTDAEIVEAGRTLPGDKNVYPGDPAQYFEPITEQHFEPLIQEQPYEPIAQDDGAVQLGIDGQTIAPPIELDGDLAQVAPIDQAASDIAAPVQPLAPLPEQDTEQDAKDEAKLKQSEERRQSHSQMIHTPGSHF